MATRCQRAWVVAVVLALALVPAALVLLSPRTALPEVEAAAASSALSFGPAPTAPPEAVAIPATTAPAPPEPTLDDVLREDVLRTCENVALSPPMDYGKPLDFYPSESTLFLPDGTKHVAPRAGGHTLPEAARRLMVVAHADDELLFGGSDLLAGPPNTWLVVVSNRVGIRMAVMPNVTRHFELAGLLTMEHFEKWQLLYYDARFVRDLDALLRARTWDVVVTHQAAGEYGNTQHIALHAVVLALAMQPSVTTVRELRAFQYHPRNHAPAETKADDSVYARLRTALNMYGQKIVDSFGKQIPNAGPSVLVDRTHPMPLTNMTEHVCWPYIPPKG